MIEMHGARGSIVGCCHRNVKGWVNVALPVQLIVNMRVLIGDSDDDTKQCVGEGKM